MGLPGGFSVPHQIPRKILVQDHDALWMELSAKKCTNPFLAPPVSRHYANNQQTPTVEECREMTTPEAPPHQPPPVHRSVENS